MLEYWMFHSFGVRVVITWKIKLSLPTANGAHVQLTMHRTIQPPAKTPHEYSNVVDTYTSGAVGVVHE